MFVIYKLSDGRIVKACMTEKGAKISFRKKYKDGHAITSLENYNKTVRDTMTVKNLMSGDVVEIDVNTPRCCDPSSELYWSM